MEIRPEVLEDVPFIRHVHQQAFHPRANEAHLVDLLRQANKATESWVAVVQGQLVGHVLFSPIAVVPDQLAIRGLGLGPIAVLPGFQRQGIGARLIEQGLNACEIHGCDLVVVVGDPRYYTRFGFSRAKPYGLDNEYDVDEAFQVRAFRPSILGSVSGLVKYQAEFKEPGC